MAKKYGMICKAQKREMYKLFLMGKTQVSIAEQFRCSVQYVSRCIHQVAEESSKAFMENVAWYKTVQTEQLRLQHEEALAAWEKSKQDAVRKTVTDDGDKVTETTTTEGQCGDPRYLSEARASLEHIRKIWGMDAPSKQEITNGHTLQIVEVLKDVDDGPGEENTIDAVAISGPDDSEAEADRATSDSD